MSGDSCSEMPGLLFTLFKHWNWAEEWNKLTPCLIPIHLVIPEAILTVLAQDEPRYVVDSGSMKYQLVLPTSEHDARFVQQKLAEKLYQVFVEEKLDTYIRRSAGKILVEILCDSDDRWKLLGEANGLDLYCTTSILLYDEDIVLKVCASAIMRILQYSGTNSETLWKPDGSQNRRSFFETLENKRASVIEQFYLYSHALQNEQSKVDETDCTAIGCYLLNLDTNNAKSLMKGPVLLTFKADKMIFISCFEDTMGWHFQYVVLQPELFGSLFCTLSTQPQEKKFNMVLHARCEDTILVNDQRQSFRILDLPMTSTDNLTEIKKELESIGVEFREICTETKPPNRKSSLLLILLDMGQDVPSESPLPAAREEQAVANISEKGLDITNELCATGRSPPKKISDTLCMSMQTNLDDNGTGPSLKLPHELNKVESQTEIQVRNSQRENTGRLRSTRRRSASYASTGTKTRHMPLNTQESLIFPRRRFRGKKYTAHSKVAVDWDEDLRESDAADENRVDKAAQATSISSALSHSTSGLSYGRSDRKGCGGVGKKKPAKSEQKRPKGPRNEKKKKKGVKLQLNTREEQSTGEVAKTTTAASKRAGSRETFSARIQRNNNLAPDVSVQGGNIENKPSDVAATDTLSLEKPGCFTPQNMIRRTSEASMRASLDKKLCNEAAYQAEGAGSTYRSPRTHTEHEQGYQGRGQTVGEKLAEALRQDVLIRQESRNRDRTEKSRLGSTLIDSGLEASTEIPDPCPDHHRCCEGVGNQGVMENEIDEISESTFSAISLTGVPSIEGCEDGTNEVNQNIPTEDDEEDQSSACPEEGQISWEKVYSSPERLRSGGANSLSCYDNSQTQLVKGDFTISHIGSCRSSPVIIENEPPAPISRGPNNGYRVDHVDSGTAFVKELPRASAKSCSEMHGRGVYLTHDTTVDENGSPRLLNRARTHPTLKRKVSLIAQEQLREEKRKRDSSGFLDVDSSLDNIDESGEENTSRFPREHTDELSCGKCDINVEDEILQIADKGISELSEAGNVFCRSAGRTVKPTPFLARLRSSASLQLRIAKTASRSSMKALGLSTEKERKSVLGSHQSEKPPLDQLDSDLLMARKLRDSSDYPNCELSLQDLHKGAQDILLNNSEHLLRQIETERNTINHILEIYREQCNGILDELFKAQEERIKVCQQQLDSIKKQHADVCHELIHRLQENERNLQERVMGNKDTEGHMMR